MVLFIIIVICDIWSRYDTIRYDRRV